MKNIKETLGTVLLFAMVWGAVQIINIAIMYLTIGL